MAQQIKFHILKSISGLEYHLAINGVILNQKLLDDLSLTLSTDMLASMFSMSELSEMLESKKRSEEYKKQTFVSNRELAEWITPRKDADAKLSIPIKWLGKAGLIQNGIILRKWRIPTHRQVSRYSLKRKAPVFWSFFLVR